MTWDVFISHAGEDKETATLTRQTQAMAIAHSLDHFLADSNVERFMSFCWAAGYQFPLG